MALFAKQEKPGLCEHLAKGTPYKRLHISYKRVHFDIKMSPLRPLTHQQPETVPSEVLELSEGWDIPKLFLRKGHQVGVEPEKSG